MLDGHDPTASAPFREMYRVYSIFSSRLTEGSTVDAVLTVATELTGGEVLLTDSSGSVTHSSHALDRRTRLVPPPLTDLLRSPVVVGSRLCATSISAPGSVYAWLRCEDSSYDVAMLTALAFTAEHSHLIESNRFRPIPEPWLRQHELVRRLLDAGPIDEARRIAAEVGHDLDRPHHVLVIEPPPGLSSTRIEDAIDPRVRVLGLVAPLDAHLVVVVDGPEDLSQVIELLRTTPGIESFHIGVSSCQPDGLELGVAHRQALTACEERSAGDGDVVSWFDDRDLLTIAMRAAGEETIDHFIDLAIGPLLSYTGPHRDEFLDSLRAWLDSTDSLDAIARDLHIHRSTLVYRIRRIRELLGHDVRDPEERFRIAAALRILERRDASSAP